MRSAIDIPKPTDLTSRWALLAIVLFVVMIGGYFMTNFILKRLAISRQRQLAELNKPHADKIITEALAAIEQVRTALLNGALLMAPGAEQLSGITRGAFDKLMNHTTVNQARYEIAARHLDSLATLLSGAYPFEFSESTTPAQTEAINRLCDGAKATVVACN